MIETGHNLGESIFLCDAAKKEESCTDSVKHHAQLRVGDQIFSDYIKNGAYRQMKISRATQCQNTI